MAKPIDLGIGKAEWGSGYKIVSTNRGTFEGLYTRKRNGGHLRKTSLQVGKAYRIYAVEVPLSEVPKDER